MYPVNRFHRITLAAISLAALILVGGLTFSRYRSGANYLPLHVSLGESADSEEFRVFVQSPFGTFSELMPDPRYKGRWKSGFSYAGVQRIIIWVRDPEVMLLDKSMVWAGESSKEAAQLLTAPESISIALPGVTGGATFDLNVQPLARSVLSWPSKTINWQGDSWLVIVPVLQAIVVLITTATALFFLFGDYRANDSPSTDSSKSGVCSSGWVNNFLGAGLWLATLLFLGQHAVLCFGELRGSRFANQYCTGMVLVAVIAVSIAVFARRVRRAQTESAIHRCAFAAIGVILAAKLAWVAGMDSVQPMDYEQYWRYGTTMAAGDWDEIRNMQNVYKSAYVVRGFVYAFPVALIFGPSLQGLEFANVLVQTLTLILFYHFGCKAIGARAACLSLPFFAVYPDTWFATTMATHETPALFWMACLFWLSERLRHLTGWTDGFSLSGFLHSALLAVGLGVVVALLDLQRSYGPFVLGASVFSFVVWLLRRAKSDLSDWRSNGVGRRNLAVGMSIGLLACMTAGTLHRSVLRSLEGYIGSGDRCSTTGLLTAIDTSRDSYLGNTISWRFLYAPAIPAEESFEFLIRKLLWEKVGVGASFWPFLARNNAILQDPFFVMQFSYCGFPGDFGVELWDISYLQLKRLVCAAAYFVLCFFSILRLLLIKTFPLRDGEVFVAGFAVSGILAILMLTEVLGPYDTFLVFPMALNVGSLLGGVRTSGRPYSQFSAISESVKWGLAFAVALVAIHQCLSLWVRISGLSLPKFGGAYDSVALGAADEVHLSPNRVSLSFRDSGDRRIPTGRVTTSIPVPAEVLKRPRVRFFLSGDQRARRIYSADSGWKDLPVTYAVQIGGDTVAAGPLADLNTPQFLVHKLTDLVSNGASEDITLVLECFDECLLSSNQQWPAITVEYLY